ncbi:MAG: SUMF1/EgtB/PvdO family nonheme iron enzyme [Deltaproteobacteria bacterium]|nr:SUMF1/EgtB/PvdO family nonheme iron enzyme [Deltaproteobacteria bacterium]
MAGPNVTEKCTNRYCEIPAGSFQMGSTSGYDDEQPAKTVTMTGFELGQTEVSVSDYQTYLAKTSTQFQAVVSGLPNLRENEKGGDFPIVGLSFDKKRAYCQAQGGDLPTAAQLHYASRFDVQDSAAGEEDQRILLENLQSTELLEFVEHPEHGYTKPVKHGYKNRLGVYNLLGNVWESALDAYDKGFYARMAPKDPYNPLTNPWSPENPAGQFQEMSGGSLFSRGQWNAGPTSRGRTSPTISGDEVGFRCARPLP